MSGLSDNVYDINNIRVIVLDEIPFVCLRDLLNSLKIEERKQRRYTTEKKLNARGVNWEWSEPYGKWEKMISLNSADNFIDWVVKEGDTEIDPKIVFQKITRVEEKEEPVLKKKRKKEQQPDTDKIKRDCIAAINIGQIVLQNLPHQSDLNTVVVDDMVANWQLFSKLHCGRVDNILLPVGKSVCITDRLYHLGYNLNYTTPSDKKQIGKLAAANHINKYGRKPYQTECMVNGKKKTKFYYTVESQDCIDDAINEYYHD